MERLIHHEALEGAVVRSMTYSHGGFEAANAWQMPGACWFRRIGSQSSLSNSLQLREHSSSFIRHLRLDSLQGQGFLEG